MPRPLRYIGVVLSQFPGASRTLWAPIGLALVAPGAAVVVGVILDNPEIWITGAAIYTLLVWQVASYRAWGNARALADQLADVRQRLGRRVADHARGLADFLDEEGRMATTDAGLPGSRAWRRHFHPGSPQAARGRYGNKVREALREINHERDDERALWAATDLYAGRAAEDLEGLWLFERVAYVVGYDSAHPEADVWQTSTRVDAILREDAAQLREVQAELPGGPVPDWFARQVLGIRELVGALAPEAAAEINQDFPASQDRVDRDPVAYLDGLIARLEELVGQP